MPHDHPTVFIGKPGSSRDTRDPDKPRDTEVDNLLLDRVRARLVLVAGLMATISLVGGGVLWLFPKFGAETEKIARGYGSLAVQFVAGVGMAFLVKTRCVPDRFLLKVGVAYQVLVCWLLAAGHTYGDLMRFGSVPAVTFAEVMIVFFPLIVPNKPKLTVMAATLSAATRPLSALAMSGHVELPAGWLLPCTLPPAIAVAMALVGSKVIYGLGTEVAKAKRMGSYHLEELLGKGGMGEVWRASHKLLARPAAVKFIRPDRTGTDPAAVQQAITRFSREAHATSLLESVHTVSVYDFGQTEDGTFFYVMELLDGVDLDQLVRDQGPLPVGRVVHLLQGVCHSLGEAHESGLIHRDIKPANLVACRYGRDLDVVKVLDFGLVTVNTGDRVDSNLTAANTVLGTPAFLAPESAKGEEVDHRADIYALGCVIYWLVAGRLVFEEDSPMALAVAHASKPAPRLSDLCDAEVPEALCDLALACVAKSPDDRPQSADELSNALADIATVEPWTQGDARAWWDEHQPRVHRAHPPTGPD